MIKCSHDRMLQKLEEKNTGSIWWVCCHFILLNEEHRMHCHIHPMLYGSCCKVFKIGHCLLLALYVQYIYNLIMGNYNFVRFALIFNFRKVDKCTNVRNISYKTLWKELDKLVFYKERKQSIVIQKSGPSIIYIRYFYIKSCFQSDHCFCKGIAPLLGRRVGISFATSWQSTIVGRGKLYAFFATL